jgi:cerevisin
MYYWAGNNINNSGVIARTDYNCQSDENLFYADTDGHGSHCTGTVAGSACGWAIDANIFAGRINFSTSNGYGAFDLGIMTLYDLIIRYHNYKKTIPSLSSRPTVTSNSYGWAMQTLSQVNSKVKELTDAGVHFVHSAGNDNSLIVTPLDSRFTVSRESSPAYPINAWTTQTNNPVICVGAIGSRPLAAANGQIYRAEYSNYGSGVSLYAPGSYIQSVGIFSSQQQYPGFSQFYLTKMSGTSMAGPNVAGVLCLLLEKFPELTPQEAKNLLLQCCTINTLSGGSLSNFETRLDNSNRLPSDPFPTNLTLSKFPATTIATVTALETFAKYLTHCYTKVDNISLSAGNIYFSILPYGNNTEYFLTSSIDLQFTNNCTPG